MRMLRPCVLSCVLIAALSATSCKREAAPAASTAPTPAAPAPASAPPPAAQAPAQRVFAQEELDQMVAPIALYPDSLLTQVLMAATYPGNVADAVAWSKAHPDAKGDAAVKLVADQPWDPSVQSLVAFPQVMSTLSQDPGWVQRLGDAFLAQPSDVMDAVQRLRRAAQAAGNLRSSEQQTVTVLPAQAAPTTVVVEGSAAPAPQAQIIQIEPANPEVVYVPSYNPTTVYGAWPYPSYPPAYYPPAPAWYPGGVLAAGLAFGTGVAVADALWGDWDWHGGDVDIDVNRYNNINVNRRIDANQNVWRHDANFRGDVPYRDARSREQFGQQRLPGADQRQQFRGNDAAHQASRDRARQEMERRGFEAPAASNRQAQERAREAGRDIQNRPGGLDARTGAGGAGVQRDPARERARETAHARTQQASQRDASQARDRASAGTHRDAGPRTTHANLQARDAARGSHAGGMQHSQVNQPRLKDHAQSRPAHEVSRNNAFEGARHPQQSRAQVERGQQSRQMQQRPQSSRSGGHQVQRQSHGGGGRRRG
ncbi:DUF3300 domain-containing protein [Lysobacter auxotrophicus]|uniref:DUF3300 domain-containing protein n=1 Tax=Lysobacter auxotrophicus TaxID=2992573 RepID=A0ABN6UFM8_9GAMM|nr:DUF3300 domain-containing protein [Lysobacter auxotrophicus]BDU15093.1 DUF3300 domain-containing protein [Lysobacter auxotrophicus]